MKTENRIPPTVVSETFPSSNGEQPRQPTSEEIAGALQQRRERVQRASEGVREVLQRERCQIRLASLVFGDKGTINPVIQIDVLD